MTLGDTSRSIEAPVEHKLCSKMYSNGFFGLLGSSKDEVFKRFLGIDSRSEFSASWSRRIGIKIEIFGNERTSEIYSQPFTDGEDV